MNGYIVLVTSPIFEPIEICEFEGTFGELLVFALKDYLEGNSAYIIFFERDEKALLDVYLLVEEINKSLLDSKQVYSVIVDVLKSRNVDYIGFDLFESLVYIIKIWRIDISEKMHQKLSDLLSKECPSYKPKILDLFEVYADSSRSTPPEISITCDARAETFIVALKGIPCRYVEIKASNLVKVKTLEEFVILL